MPVQIGYDIRVKGDPVLLEKKHIHRTAGQKKALGLSPGKERTRFDRRRIVIPAFAVALGDTADHQGNNFDHRHKPDTTASFDISIDQSDHALVLGIWACLGNDRKRVA